MKEFMYDFLKEAEEYADIEYSKQLTSKTRQDIFIQKFADLVSAMAFRCGIMHCAEKYVKIGSERITGNDVSLFLEMQAYELDNEEIVSKVQEYSDSFIGKP